MLSLGSSRESTPEKSPIGDHTKRLRRLSVPAPNVLPMPSYDDIQTQRSRLFSEASENLDYADHYLKRVGDTDPAFDELSKPERAAIAAAYAQLAQSSALLGLMRSQDLLFEELHQTNLALQNILTVATTPPVYPPTR